MVMRELILLRHAEAMQLAVDGSDRERPLSLRGEQEARAAGAWLREQDIVPDLVLSSPARRAQMTVERALDALGGGTPRYLPGIFNATPGDLLALLGDNAAAARRVLLVGHNPGLEQLLALLLSGRSGQVRGMPPGSIACVEWPDDGEWSGLEPGSGRLRAFWSP